MSRVACITLEVTTLEACMHLVYLRVYPYYVYVFRQELLKLQREIDFVSLISQRWGGGGGLGEWNEIW